MTNMQLNSTGLSARRAGMLLRKRKELALHDPSLPAKFRPGHSRSGSDIAHFSLSRIAPSARSPLDGGKSVEVNLVTFDVVKSCHVLQAAGNGLIDVETAGLVE